MRIDESTPMHFLRLHFLNDCIPIPNDCGFYVDLMPSYKIKPAFVIHFCNAIHYYGRARTAWKNSGSDTIGIIAGVSPGWRQMMTNGQ